ncbi:MAG: hypothetical protein LBJ11_10930 [Oscillospiraceae bacterium]|jgi:hypothetical protein|nr:hypothetical protein [Oscillospiraceae bacterium]
MNEQYRVHVGFGFHVNCYHSYRGDSNDELGFGGDIRVIRKIIAILNDCNSRGIPVKGTWDFENAYSLEDILPKYAPDIIDGVRERVRCRGDENILMGYNNGALGAMTPDEFDASIAWAIRNGKGSGLEDLFGTCERIVRPQEFMFTPSQVRDYRRAGIEAVCLYYSCIPFDAFRTIVPQLRDELAFNPATYTWQGEGITILPTYSNADLVDAGTLRWLVKDLRRQQLAGKINRDVFVFINMDADAIFWEPLGLPGPLGKLANARGILGLAEEVADLDFVVYDTPGGYLRHHPPLAEVSFGHDTADGSYTGYASWAEKPFNRQIWTRLERARALAKAQGRDADSASFGDRILLLSTTHFGLASPVLNVDRERRALELSAQMTARELAARETPAALTLCLPDAGAEDGAVASAELCFDPGFLPEIGRLRLEAEGLETFGAVALEEHLDSSVASAFAVLRFGPGAAWRTLTVTVLDEAPAPAAIPAALETASLRLRFCEHGELRAFTYHGKPIGGPDFLQSFLRYDGRLVRFTPKKRLPLPAAGAAVGLRITGDIPLPEAAAPGRFTYDFFTLPGLDGVFLPFRVKYPYTPETHALSTHSSALGRKTDNRWQEAVPLQLLPRLTGPLSVVKRNFTGALSSYPIASFRESVPENENLDSFNHQLSGGFVGLTNGETGLCLANARQVLNSMACCPMRLRRRNEQDTVALNPFGTYTGRQRVHPSRSNGSIREAFVMTAPQARSLAPAYNGVTENGVLGLFGFAGAQPDEALLRDMTGFADGTVLLEPAGSPVHAPGAAADHVRFPALQADDTTAAQLKPVLVSGVRLKPLRLARTAALAFGTILVRQIKGK